MTELTRRRPKPEPNQPRRRRPITERFPQGTKVTVVEDCQHERFAGRFGTVVSVDTTREEIYPHGRVEVRLVEDDLYRKLWGGDRPPRTVWFKPNDLEKR